MQIAMHIPDGYLSPQTYVPLFAAFAGFMGVALKKVRASLSIKNIPYLGMSSAFSFLIMLFNIPAPGGTTGHAVGAGIVALVLGPWTAVVAVSVALVIQALLFGDGGITAIGANCINMAVVMPFISFWTFKLINGKAVAGKRAYFAAFMSGYMGLSIAALAAGIEFGIQPIIASSNGKPLYAPYGLEIAVPAMLVGHLLLFGIIEGLATLLVFMYFLKNDPGEVYVFKKGRI